MAPTRTAAPVALAVALALGLSACGGTDSETAPTSGPATTAPATDAPTGEATEESTATAAQSGDYEVGETIPLAEFQEQVETAMREAGTMTMIADGNEMQAELFPDSINLRSEVDGGMLFVDGVLYIEAGPDMADIADGKGWLVIDPDSDDPMSQLFAPLLSAMTSIVDPTTTMGNPDKDVTVSAVDGNEVTFEIVLTEAEIRAQAAEMYGAGMPGLADSPELAGDMTYLYTVDTSTWLPVRIETEDDEGTSIVEYTGFGEPVDIEAPPAEDTAPFTLDLGGLPELGDLEDLSTP